MSQHDKTFLLDLFAYAHMGCINHGVYWHILSKPDPLEIFKECTPTQILPYFVGYEIALELEFKGYKTFADLLGKTKKDLMAIPKIEQERATEIIAARDKIIKTAKLYQRVNADELFVVREGYDWHAYSPHLIN